MKQGEYTPPLVVGMQTHTATMKVNMSFPKKIWTLLTSRPSQLDHSWDYAQRTLHSTSKVLAQLC